MLRLGLLASALRDAMPMPMPTWPAHWGVNASAPAGGVLGGCSGHLFGFSGLDGATSERADFVGVFEGSAAPRSFALRFCGLNTSRTLTVQMPGPITATTTATNDVLQIASDGAKLSMAFVEDDLLAGLSPPGSGLWLNDSVAYTGAAAPAGVTCRSAGALALCTSPTTRAMPWGLAYDTAGVDAAVRTAAAAACTSGNCSFSLARAIEARLKPYASGGPRVRPQFAPVFAKAHSVMRVNALAPEGRIRQRWSTPDRMPHRWMWLWDSCYHSMAANHLQGKGLGHELGWEYLQAVLLGADSSGAVAIMRTPDTAGQTVEQTQPPLLAWAVHENYERARLAGATEGEVLDRLRWAVPRLERYLRWDFAQRADPSGATPLLCWTKGTESGMDNSPRFDWVGADARQLLSVDFSVFAARESAYVASMHAALGNESAAATWKSISTNLSSAVHSHLWDDSRGFYYDVMGGKYSPVAAVSGLLPLWLPDLPKERLQPLLDKMTSPRWFGTAVPLASVARDDPSFSIDMWRGPTWLNTNYHVVLALLSQGQAGAARRLVNSTLATVQRQYEAHGVLFEFYDADGAHDPRTLMRKGSPTGGVREYHWTAALVYIMALMDAGTA